MPVGGRRRAAGLRREELAALAGISVDYLTRLEQGRATSPSAQVVEALARALRLSDAERELLFRLAGPAPPGPGCRLDADHAERAAPARPARAHPGRASTTRRGTSSWPMRRTTRSWARPRRGAGSSATACGATSSAPAAAPSTPPRSSAEHRVRWLVADLRMTAARYPADRALRRLIAELPSREPALRRAVGLGRCAGRTEIGPGTRSSTTPTVGPITLDCDTLIVAGDDLRIMVYTAEPGTEDAERLALAIVLGTQSLVR